MTKRFRGTAFGVLICLFLFPAAATAQAPVAVRYTEGLLHGFLVLRTLDGDTVADGDISQIPSADRVTVHLAFHFKDGSLYEDTTVFSQRRTFRFISDHLVEKGPAFPRPMDVSLNATGQIAIRYTDHDGKEQSINDRLKLPTNVANGMLPIFLANLAHGAPLPTLSMVVETPKPRIVKLVISSSGEDSFTVGTSSFKATHYVIKIDIGGAAGLVAPIIGKAPPDTHLWVLDGNAPVFVKMEGPLFAGGPIWRTELASPVWPNH